MPMHGFPAQGMPAPPSGFPVATNPGFNRAPAQAAPPNIPSMPSSAPGPVIRAQSSDEPVPPPVESRPAPLQMPSPEQLGLKPASGNDPDRTDWSDAHRRLEQIGALSFCLEKLAEGGCRFCCALPTQGIDRVHRIEVRAASEVEAVGLALQEAEAWTRKK